MAMKVVPSAIDAAEKTTPNMHSTEHIVLDKMANHHIRVAVVGNVDAGKSTLIGTLVSNTLDDGRGLARSKIVKHKQEQETGRTASITSHVMGLVSDDDTVKTVTGDYQNVALKSERVVSLMDLAGHEST